MIKRGLSATLEELLMAAEYILKEGNPNVLLCERGIRTFETAYRLTLVLTAVPVVKELSHLPARPHTHARANALLFPAGHRRSEPGRRPPLASGAAVAGRGRRRRRRDHR